MSQPLIDHFFTETSRRLSGYTGQAFKRQHAQVRAHMANVMREHGPQELAEVMHNVVEFADAYPGSKENVFLGDIFSAIGELRTANIEPGSSAYKEQLEHMASKELIGAAEHTRSQGPTREQAAANHLQQALKHHKQELARAQGPYEQEHEIQRLERTISRIEGDIQQLNGSVVPPKSAPDKPALSPEALARQQAEDKAVMDSIARADANQQRDLIDPADTGGENWDADFDEDDDAE